MPHITNQWSVESTVTGWQKRDVSKHSTFPNLKPKFPTSDLFSNYWGRLPYRDQIDYSQVYSGDSRKNYLARLKTCLHKFPCERTLLVRWRFDKEVPAFSMEFLLLYLTRFGKVEAIFQQAVNACLVLFRHHRTAWLVANARDLGLPYGRLYTKWWNPLPQDAEQLRIMRHIEKAAETRTRFHSLMDMDDRLSMKKVFRGNARAMADSNRYGGPSLRAYLCEGVKRTEQVMIKSPKPKPRQPLQEGSVNVIKTPEDFHRIIKGDKLIVVDFYATWCGPCKVIAPVIEEWAKEFRDVTFAKLNVDEVPEVCEDCRISAMPTFLFFKNSVLLDTMIGAFQDKLKEKIMSLK